MKKEYILIISNERPLESIIKDFFTFGILSFCIWFSAGSKIWTFICVCLFVAFLGGKISRQFNRDVKKFKTKEEAIDFMTKELQ